MSNIISTARLAALGALVLGLGIAGFAISASAQEAAGRDTTGASEDQSGHRGVVHGGGNGHSGLGGTGGNPSGEGALLEGNCFADMPVYTREGKFVGRGIVNTCN